MVYEDLVKLAISQKVVAEALRNRIQGNAKTFNDRRYLEALVTKLSPFRQPEGVLNRKSVEAGKFRDLIRQVQKDAPNTFGKQKRYMKNKEISTPETEEMAEQFNKHQKKKRPEYEFNRNFNTGDFSTGGFSTGGFSTGGFGEIRSLKRENNMRKLQIASGIGLGALGIAGIGGGIHLLNKSSNSKKGKKMRNFEMAKAAAFDEMMGKDAAYIHYSAPLGDSGLRERKSMELRGKGTTMRNVGSWGTLGGMVAGGVGGGLLGRKLGGSAGVGVGSVLGGIAGMVPGSIINSTGRGIESANVKHYLSDKKNFQDVVAATKRGQKVYDIPR